MTGVIIKATGGFYYVRADVDGSLVECRARGLFRFAREKATPLSGDRVRITTDANGSGTVVEILLRKNQLVRPPLANLDYMAAVVSLSDPLPNLLILDKFLAILENADIPPILIITKPDLHAPGELETLYHNAGFQVYVVCSPNAEGVDELKSALTGKVGAFFGNSGVGKSSLLNAIDPRFDAPVGDTSKKLGRGRHTTRHVEFFSLEGGGMIADTPGFSTVDIEAMGGIGKSELPACFREFRPYLDKCRFTDCSHTKEKGCAVLEALGAGDIMPSRHQSYTALYNEIKNVKEWESNRSNERRC